MDQHDLHRDPRLDYSRSNTGIGVFLVIGGVVLALGILIALFAGESTTPPGLVPDTGAAPAAPATGTEAAPAAPAVSE